MHRWCTRSDTRRGAGCSREVPQTRVDPQRELAELTRDEGLVADLAEANGEVESVAYEIDLAIVDLHHDINIWMGPYEVGERWRPRRSSA